MGAGRIKILLVDDDQDAYVLTQELLSESGSDRYEAGLGAKLRGRPASGDEQSA